VKTSKSKELRSSEGEWVLFLLLRKDPLHMSDLAIIQPDFDPVLMIG